MFTAVILMCATTSGEGCVITASPTFNTEAACLADMENGMRASVALHPDLIPIEHRCIEWHYTFPNV